MCFWLGNVVLREFDHVLSAHHVRFYPCHPYLDTDGLIRKSMHKYYRLCIIATCCIILLVYVSCVASHKTKVQESKPSNLYPMEDCIEDYVCRIPVIDCLAKDVHLPGEKYASFLKLMHF